MSLVPLTSNERREEEAHLGKVLSGLKMAAVEEISGYPRVAERLDLEDVRAMDEGTPENPAASA